MTLRPLHVVESWLPVQTGYTTRSAALVAAQERSAEMSPRVVVTSRQSVYGATGVAEEDMPGRVLHTSSSPREARVRRVRGVAVDGAALRARVVDAVDSVGADLVHAHWSSGIGTAARAAAREKDLPFVAEVRFDLAGAVTAQTARLPWARARTRLESALRRHFERHLRGADAVISASASLAVLLRETVPRVHVAPNGCEPQRFTPGPPDPALATELGLDGRLVVGTTSTMLRYEGLDLLLDAAARLRRRHPELVVLLVGDGPERARLAAHAERLGVRCVFTGRVAPEEVAAHYRLLDVMVLPRRDLAVTRYAGPVKLLEALAAGRACLGSDVGDIGELLSTGRGVVVAPGDLDELTDALGALLDDPARRDSLGRHGRHWAETAGTWDAAAAVHRSVYADLVPTVLPR